jgi:succinate dehydrogenase/fumarate reductase cytochrome b subunit
MNISQERLVDRSCNAAPCTDAFAFVFIVATLLMNLSESKITHIAPIGMPQTSPVTWPQVQALTGLAMAPFVAVHLLSTAAAVVGPRRYDAMMDALRAVYQHPALEAALLVAIALHIVAAVRVRCFATATLAQTPISAAPTVRQLAHRYGGWFMALITPLHVFSTRLAPGSRHDFAGLAYTMQRVPLLFRTYFTVFAFSGVAHLLIGMPAALRGVRSLPAVRRLTGYGGRRSFAARLAYCSVPWWAIMAGSAAVVVGLAALCGAFYDLPADIAEHPYSRHFDAKMSRFGL